MPDRKWSPSEKKIARRAYDAALGVALARILAEFKAKAAQAATPSEMWDLEDYLRRQRRHIDTLFDYRYSQLTFVFAAAIREGYMDESSLAGLSEEKLEPIRRLLRSWMEE
ncbi:hypothetical protein [Inquilinus limosus]|uniref:Fluorescence recovery protein (RFP) n=1 Tax=Inquilinus limosus MP06 TaxID=1398085 RepID=A0A0A0D309_9PROT|nr:hypothetical protein [Inquilinus limosus]KGM32380.1 hypothetical protein P409_21750 [Inquilinus limosus MP06]